MTDDGQNQLLNPARAYAARGNNERTYRDGMQPNKVGMTQQYSYGLSSLYLLPFYIYVAPVIHIHCACDS